MLATNIDPAQLVEDAIEKAESFLQEGRFKELEIITKQILKVDPDCVPATKLLGLSRYEMGKNKEALELFEKVLETTQDAETHNNISLCYARLGKTKEATEHIKKAIELAPDNGHYCSNFAQFCRQKGDIDTAEDVLQHALELSPNSYEPWLNMGSVYGFRKNYKKAIECFRKSLSIKENAATHVDISHALFFMDEWEQAWKEYEYRLQYYQQMDYFNKIYDKEKRWDGQSSLEGKNIVVFCEQGAGDFIQFFRYLPDLFAKGCKIFLHTPPELRGLFNANNYCFQTGLDFKEYDYNCSILSLPHLLKIPKRSYLPYIKSSKEADLSAYDTCFKIGIVWAGNPQHPNDLNRSCPLRFFKPISDIPEAKLFSLQKDLRPRAYPHHPTPIDLTEHSEKMEVVDLSRSIEDFEDTAAIIEKMDLIATVDTAVLHLSGALGKKTLALIPNNPDWRWGDKGEETFWYKNMALMRQKSFGNWTELFEQVVQKIKGEINERKSHTI